MPPAPGKELLGSVLRAPLLGGSRQPARSADQSRKGDRSLAESGPAFSEKDLPAHGQGDVPGRTPRRPTGLSQKSRCHDTAPSYTNRRHIWPPGLRADKPPHPHIAAGSAQGIYRLPRSERGCSLALSARSFPVWTDHRKGPMPPHCIPQRSPRRTGRCSPPDHPRSVRSGSRPEVISRIFSIKANSSME